MSKLLIIIIAASVILLFFMRGGSTAITEESYEKSVPADWFVDFDEALLKSTKENKLIFAVFSGSDWCPPCKKLAKDVFETPEWALLIKDQVIFVYLDFPRSKELPSRLKNLNNDLAQKYEIRSFPSCLILNNKGELVSYVYYRFDDSETFIKKVQEALSEKG